MLNGLKSKKIIVSFIAAIGIIVNDLLGKPVSEDAIYSALGILGAYVIGQGISDAGSQGAAKAVERALNKGGDIAKAVQGVFNNKSGGNIVHDDDDDGPDEEDIDEEDKKVLLG